MSGELPGDALEAVVQVGAVETTYLRCGRGPVMLVVTPDEAERRLLIELLRPCYCVIAPVPPVLAAGADAADAGAAGQEADLLADWLAGVVEGLGVERPGIITGAAGPGFGPGGHIG